MNKEDLWQAALGELELSVSKASFTTWFKDTCIFELCDTSVVISVPNNFTREWFEKRYHDIILKTLKSISKGSINNVSYRVGYPQDHKKTQQKTQRAHTVVNSVDSVPSPTPIKQITKGLNPKYTFSTFIVGKSNELAHAASRAVAVKPGYVYNPLFIYGDVGLGKTHLMQAIGCLVLENEPNRKIIYTTCEKFTNDFVHSIKTGQASRFQNYYRSADILLIDDIQFIGGKEQTQEQFFHTFNSLHQTDKQIVITSDRPPRAISGLESRLQSRFEWGMIADIAQPDLETRIAILEAKLAEKNFKLEQDVVSYIASQIQNNIREMEGVINRIIAMFELNHTPPNLDSIKEVISSLTSQTSRGALTSSQLLQIVSDFFNVTHEELIGASRKKHLVVPRQITMYLMREELEYSFPVIGQELGGRDHTTAIHAYEKIKRDLSSSEKLRQDISLIKNILYKDS